MPKSSAAPPSDLTATCPDGLTVVSERCFLRTRAGQRLVVFGGVPIYGFQASDATGTAYAEVLIDQSGFATQAQIATAFNVVPRTVQRNVERYRSGGIEALGRPRGWEKGRTRLEDGLQKRAARLKRKSLSNVEIGVILGISPPSVAKLLAAEGLKAQDAGARAQLSLGVQTEGVPVAEATGAAPAEEETLLPGPAEALEPCETEPEEEAGERAGGEVETVLAICARAGAEEELEAGKEGVPVQAPSQAAESEASLEAEGLGFSFDSDPADRSVDRVMAAKGMLADAMPMFRDGTRVSGAGVLLAVPVLVASGILEVARQVYGSLRPAFYGLRTTCLTLLLMALLRIKRPEALKERCPRELGRILGLDRAPEVKTLRRKLQLLCERGGALELVRKMAERRIKQQGDVLGFLYVDGHVRVYHGKRTLPKTHVARMRLSLPATTDYWVNDAAGDPVFALTAEANAGLVEMLPELTKQMKSLLGERRVTVVFDRGGYSPALFRTLVEAGVDLLTYRKGPFRKMSRKDFRTYVGTKDGQRFTWELADQRVRLGKTKGTRIELRQVTRRSPDGHQTPILTTRRDLTALEVAERMFDRWQQENYFKYAREQFALDALLTYAVEPDDPERDVPNPKWAALDGKLTAAKAELKRLQAQYGQRALVNRESQRPTMRGFKIANGRIGQALRAAARRVEELTARRAKIPTRIPVRQRHPGEPIVKLHAEMGRLQNLLKMVACQAESDLVRLLAPHYPRNADEGRTFIQAALSSPADITVGRDSLSVVFSPQSSPHRSAALQALCDELNEPPTLFPGTKLRLRFRVAHHPDTP